MVLAVRRDSNTVLRRGSKRTTEYTRVRAIVGGPVWDRVRVVIRRVVQMERRRGRAGIRIGAVHRRTDDYVGANVRRSHADRHADLCCRRCRIDRQHERGYNNPNTFASHGIPQSLALIE